jgi:ribosomal protein L33
MMRGCARVRTRVRCGVIRGEAKTRALRVSSAGGLTSSRFVFFDAQNRRNTSGRMELMKYNPFLRKHTLHRELKK